jgi:hypothetical protein
VRATAIISVGVFPLIAGNFCVIFLDTSHGGFLRARTNKCRTNFQRNRFAAENKEIDCV